MTEDALLPAAKPPPALPRLSREVLLTGGLLAVMVFGLAGLAAATGWREVLASLGALNSAQVAALLALSGMNYLLRGLRWHLYARVLKLPVGVMQTIRHYLGGFAMTVTPGRVGELIRLRWITRETGVSVDRAAPIVLMDRAADLAAMGLLIAVSVALSTAGLRGGIPLAAIAIVAAVVVTRANLLTWALERSWRLIGRAPRLFARVRRAARSIGPFSDWPVVLPALALGFAGWFAEGLSFYYLLGWMGAEVPLWTAVGIFMIATVGGGLTGAPGGLGGAEAAMVGLLSLQGVPLEVSIPATAVIRLTTLWFAIAIGLVVFPIATRAAHRGLHAT
ncbi:MAG: lysylphosphatidylglycerol synthase transmembrane domain-containing protein [Pseudomonadota bacterium]